MGLGALFAALNSMHSAVAARTVEIATLKALGFGPTPIIVALLIEAVLLAGCGAILGVTTAIIAFDGQAISTIGGALWDSQLVYALDVDASLTATAIAVACGLGLLGALHPAVRAARLNVAEGLQAS
jgi:putative ABC transport system permease protein